MLSRADLVRCGTRDRPGCGQIVRKTKTEAGNLLLVNVSPDRDGNTAVWRDVHGVLRSRRVSKDRPLLPYEKLMMPHPATCSGPARRRSTLPKPPPLRVGELYGRLGVASTATPDEIRKAYRRLARQLHPDLNPSDAAAAERFKGITEAYDVLSDPKQRAIYDLSGCQPRPH